MMPIGAGLLAFGGKWKEMGPFNIGPIYRVVAFLCILIACGILYIGVQPPNDKALQFMAAIAVITLLVWFLLENRRFKGPPITEADVAARQAAIAAAEVAVGQKT